MAGGAAFYLCQDIPGSAGLRSVAPRCAARLINNYMDDLTTRAHHKPRRGKERNMKKTLALICLSFMRTSAAFAASSRENLQARMDASKVVLDQIMAAQDNSIPLNILQHA